MSRFYFTINGSQEYFTKTELHIVLNILKYKNLDLVAERCLINKKTLYSHLKNIKIKIGCGTFLELSFSLIDIFSKHK